MSIDIDAVRQRHLRPEQMEHRTFYEGHIVIDLGAALDEIERLQNIIISCVEQEAYLLDACEAEQVGRGDDRLAVVAYLRHLANRVAEFDDIISPSTALGDTADVIADAGYPLHLTLPSKMT